MIREILNKLDNKNYIEKKRNNVSKHRNVEYFHF